MNLLSRSVAAIDREVFAAPPGAPLIRNMRRSRAVVTGFAHSWALATGLFLALILLTQIHKVAAADITVDANCSLPDAIQAAESDAAVRGCAAGSGADTIHLSGDVALAAALPQINSDITIEGGGYSISGNSEFRIFEVSGSRLTIKQLTVTGGYAESGGAIFNDGSVHLSNCSFINNAAAGGETKDGGGAIYSNGDLVVRNCEFTNNSAHRDGLFDGYGGAILSRGNLTVSNSEFTENSADRGGGGILSDGALTITGSQFARNSAGGGGAILHDTHETLKISNSGFRGNEADEGGAISNRSSAWISIIDSTFVDNSASGWGSAIMNKYGRLTVDAGTFTGNSAGTGGSINNNSTAEIKDSIFHANTAEAASAVFNGGSNLADMVISNSEFSNNSAQEFSGAIMNGRGGTLTVNDSRFVGNSASSGGAITNVGQMLSVTGSNFSNNSATGMDSDVGDSIIERAFVAGAGGGVLNLGPLNIADSSFVDNSAGFGGAIFSLVDLEVLNSTLARNTAVFGGGLYIYFSYPSIATLTQLTVVNNSANEGGGITVAFEAYEETAFNLYNSLLARNTGGDCSAETLSASGGNLIEDGACDPAISGDPKLGALVEPDDGSPAYYPLLPDSPAIDAADPDHCSATDQTGTARPQGAACDIGAYEFPGD